MYKAQFHPPSFCQWVPGETTEIKYGQAIRRKGKQKSVASFKTRYIPTPYVRIMHQLYHEYYHAGDCPIYEAQRRGSYAARVLDAFGVELDGCSDLETDGPHAGKWHSAVLTPILQRQIYGIPDTVASWVHHGILHILYGPPAEGNNNDRDLTISDITRFYLATDPLDPNIIPTLRQNLIWTREARWHLAVLLGSVDTYDQKHFLLTVEHQDALLESPGQAGDQETGIPPFSPLEASVLVREKLRKFYVEVNNMVGVPLSVSDTH
jgi:hypothetical protein